MAKKVQDEYYRMRSHRCGIFHWVQQSSREQELAGRLETITQDLERLRKRISPLGGATFVGVRIVDEWNVASCYAPMQTGTQRAELGRHRLTISRWHEHLRQSVDALQKLLADVKEESERDHTRERKESLRQAMGKSSDVWHFMSQLEYTLASQLLNLEGFPVAEFWEAYDEAMLELREIAPVLDLMRLNDEVWHDLEKRNWLEKLRDEIAKWVWALDKDPLYNDTRQAMIVASVALNYLRLFTTTPWMRQALQNWRQEHGPKEKTA